MIQVATHPLLQLEQVLHQVSSQDFSKPLPSMSGSSLGMHIRHIIEFYECLIDGIEQGEVNYDNRKRNALIETNKDYAAACIEEIIKQVNIFTQDKHISTLHILHDVSEPVHIQSTVFREIAYVIEHTIHHLAIIKIACKQDLSYIQFDENFGVAYSTIKYKEHVHSQLHSNQ